MNIFNHTRPLFNRFRSLARFDPVRDWIALLTISILAFVGIVIWNVWAFDTVAQGGIIGETMTDKQSLFSRSSADAIHAVFEKRADEETKYRTGVYRYADPSQ